MYIAEASEASECVTTCIQTISSEMEFTPMKLRPDHDGLNDM